MTTAEWFLLGWVALAVLYLSDSIWRLRRARPSPFMPVFLEVLLPFLFIWMALSGHEWRTRDLVAKALVIAGFGAAAVVRLMARRRFTVQA